MGLINIVKRLSRSLRTKLVLPLSIAAATMGVAYAQEGFNDPNTVRKEPETTQTEKKSKTEEDVFSGYVGGEAYTSKRKDTILTKGQLTFNPGDGWRLNAYGLSSWETFANDTEDLDAHNEQYMVGLGKYLAASRKLELYGELGIGLGKTEFREALDLDGHRLLYGGRVGAASQDSGSKVELGLYKGKGSLDYKLISGFEGDGDFDTFTASAELTQRLIGYNRTPSQRGEFDVKSLGEEFKQSLYAVLKLFKSEYQYGDLQECDGAGVEFSLPYVMNFRELFKDGKGNVYSEGHLWRFTPFAQWQNYDTKSDISVRKTDSDDIRLGLRAELEISKWVAISAEAGYEWYKLNADDPVRGDSTDEKNGFAGSVSVYLKW